jgi:hypothetical protein
MGWEYFAEVACIEGGSLLLRNVEARNASIRLDFVKIRNP